MNYLGQLTQLGQVPVDMTLEALASTGRAKQAETIGLQELMRKQQFEQSADPMRLQRMQTDNDMGLQQLYGAKRKNKEEDFTSPARMMAEYQGYLAKASDSDLQLATNKFQELAFSNDPKQRALGEAGLKQTKDFIMQRQKDAADMARVGAQGHNAKELMQMQIDAGRFKKNDKAGYDLAVRIDMENDPRKKQALLIDAAQQAAAAGDTEQAEFFTSRARALDPAVAGQNAARAKEGALDLTGVTGGQVPTKPVPSTMPTNSPAPTSGRIRVKSPDGKVGSIPADQLQEALKSGYSKVD
jgi:hypothetical protein